MQVRKGNDRIVFIFPRLKFVVKIPIIHLISAIINIHDIIKGKMWRYLKMCLTYSVGVDGAFKAFLFKGLAANWGEFCFYWKTRHAFLQPTYFSLFGFLNIQQYDEPCQLKGENIGCQISGLAPDKVTSAAAHHLENPNNFCFHNGKLRMLDYGSRRCQDFIVRHGTKVIKHFSPAYSWEEREKELSTRKKPAN